MGVNSYSVQWLELSDEDIVTLKGMIEGGLYDNSNSSVLKLEDVLYVWVNDSYYFKKVKLQKANMLKLYDGLKEFFPYKGVAYRGLKGEDLLDIDLDELVSYSSRLDIALNFNGFYSVAKAIDCENKEDALLLYGVDLNKWDTSMLYMLIESEIDGLNIRSLMEYVIERSSNATLVDLLSENLFEDEVVAYSSADVDWYTYDDLKRRCDTNGYKL